MKLNILSITVHPDDTELCCAGTLLKMIDQGYTVGIIDLTRGELGTRGNAELRLKEADAAAKVLGVKVRENLGMPDGFFKHARKNLIKIVRVVRKYQPDVVITNALSDRHPDHARASKLVSDACFLSGLIKVPTEIDGQVQDRWRPKAVYHIIQDHQLHPDFCVDITDYYEKKIEAIKCFSSQFYDPKSKDLDSPISSKDFFDYVEAYSRSHGRRIGVTFAEGFNVDRPIGVPDIMEIF